MKPKRKSDVMLMFANVLCPVGYLMDTIKIPFNYPNKIGHYTLDFAHPEAKIDIEIDETYHQRGTMPLRDKQRDNHVRGLGWKVIRIKVTKSDRIILK
jgi:very-short-patch-repair endonuclease